MTRSRPGGEWLIFLALGVMWGSSYLFIKLGVETITPLTLVAVRLGIGALTLAALFRLAGERLPRDGRTWLHLSVMAVANIVVPFSLITWAELSMPSSLAAILTATTPLFAIVIAAGVLRSEPISPRRVVGLAVGFVGVIVLVGPSAFGSGSSIAAVLAVLAAALSYASATVYARRTLVGRPPMVSALGQVGIAFAISLPLALLLEQPLALDYDASAIVSLLWLGIVGSGVAYVAYFGLIRAWGATRTSAVAYLLPVVGIVLGVVVANERVDLRVVAGTALVLGGVALLNVRRRWFVRRPIRIEVEPAS